jgi:ATP-dependent DNA helicase DinG
MNITDKYSDMIKAIPNYKIRDGQMQMVIKIDECLANIDADNDEGRDGSNIVFIEAPTGTGKSIGYLFAGLINAINHDKQLVITTATKTLQNQLCEVDIPNFINYSGYNFSYGLAKGRSNFLCPYQLELSLNGDIEDNLFEDMTKTINDLTILDNYFKLNKWDGDLDKAPININSKTRSIITIDKDSCLNNTCPYNQKDDSHCPYFIRKSQLKNNQVVVTNHSFLLADLILGGGVILPNRPDDYILCIDEAHNFTDIAIDSFSYSVTLQDTILQLTNLRKIIYNEVNKSYIYAIDSDVAKKFSDYLLDLLDTFNNLLMIIEANYNQLFIDNDTIILNDYIEPKSVIFKDLFIELNHNINNCYQLYNKIINELKDKLKTASDYTIENNLHKLGFYATILNNIFLTADNLIHLDDSRYNARAKWLKVDIKDYKHLFTVNVSTTHVGSILFDLLWSKVYGAIITSATLCINNNFNYYIYKFGLNFYSNIAQVKLSSGYDYTKQAQIVVPKFKNSPDYNLINQFNKELAQYLIKTIDYSDAYGTLVIFYNKNHLLEVYDNMPKHIQNKILLQTNFINNQVLITQHKKVIDNGSPSIIFGLNSFAEGVDLPKIYCIHVIITKLPFDTFNNPAKKVQEYWCSYEKVNYFNDVLLPEACIKLIQASGRLIRSENDYGQITICDSRLVNKKYGIYLLNSLPNFNRRYEADFISKAFKLLEHF